jgi:GTP-binding protein
LESTLIDTGDEEAPKEWNGAPISNLNPPPEDYGRSIFTDRATITIVAGDGGHGCISFLKEKYISDGPANGGDGGYGGSIYIQAERGETSLHKLARRPIIKAGRGKNGQGRTKGGEKGDDIIIKVPVGTVIREVERTDPVTNEEMRLQLEGLAPSQPMPGGEGEEFANPHLWDKGARADRDAAYEAEKERRKAARRSEIAGEEEPFWQDEDAEGFHGGQGDLAENQEPTRPAGPLSHDGPYKWDKKKWLLYPAITPEDIRSAEFPHFPQPRRSHLAASQEQEPINIDLSIPMEKPHLLAAGAVGGLGNPHFVTKTAPKPKFATRGELGTRITLELELKLLADVGLVGLPNAGKSTLIRSMTNSRARVGNWAFTTLQPNIGTVVLDDNKGRPIVEAYYATGERRTNFTIADIPGLVKDAHLDRGLGISFLRHVERAGVLSFVIDLSAGDAVGALKALWRELIMYERMKADEDARKEADQRDNVVSWSPMAAQGEGRKIGIRWHDRHPRTSGKWSIIDKPWFVVASKADKEGTRENYAALKQYLADVTKEVLPHPAVEAVKEQDVQLETENKEEAELNEELKDELPGVVVGKVTSETVSWKPPMKGYTKNLVALPISAINGHGTDAITMVVVDMLKPIN